MASKIMNEATKYESFLRGMIKDGKKLSPSDANKIVSDAKSGDFTEVKALYLASFLQTESDHFDPAAKKTLETFVNGSGYDSLAKVEPETGTMPTSDTAEPALSKDDTKSGGVTYRAPSGSLTVKGFGNDDAIQGALGDCYFISSMMAVANTHPEILQKAIRDNGNGTYTVSFWQHDDMNSAPHKVEITVDGKLPEKSGQPEYVGSRSGKELWPSIFEKAYAQWKGGSYENIEGGMGANALSALTGARPGFFAVDGSMKPDDVWAKLQSACAKGGCVVADSTGFKEGVSGIVGDHTYTVLGTEEKNGQKLVKLRNPWGEKEPGHDGTDDGIFEMPIEDFVKAYGMVEYVKP